MLLPGIRTIFKSRWSALIWAAGILWLAYDVAGHAPSGHASDGSVSPANDQPPAADAKQVEKLLAGKF